MADSSPDVNEPLAEIEAPNIPSVQQAPPTGLLDLSVDLSAPEVFSGEEFSVYFQVKNPFDRPIWIREVRLSLPHGMHWNQESLISDQLQLPSQEEALSDKRVDPELRKSIRQHHANIAQLRSQIAKMEQATPDTLTETKNKARDNQKTLEDLQKELAEKSALLMADELLMYSELGYNSIIATSDSTLSASDISFGEAKVSIRADGSSTMRISDITTARQLGAEEQTVRLRGALPYGKGLQPGNTDVWTIMLGTKWKLLFLPAQYRLQFNVIYSFHPPNEEKDTVSRTKSPTKDKPVYINTTSKTINIRTSILAVMAGALAGGISGAVAREIQLCVTLPDNPRTGLARGLNIGLAALLSVAATIFAARKAETQSFISVEDFWGGIVIGFLIGYSGSTAFQSYADINI